MSVDSGTSGTRVVSPPARTKIKLLELRALAGLSRERLAALAGLSPRTIYAIEREGVRPHEPTLYALANALNCDLEDLEGPTTEAADAG